MIIIMITTRPIDLDSSVLLIGKHAADLLIKLDSGSFQMGLWFLFEAMPQDSTETEVMMAQSISIVPTQLSCLQLAYSVVQYLMHRE